MSIYLVKEEDTIDKIAGLYDVSVEEIAYINQIPYPYRLAVGEALLIPDGVSPGVKGRRRQMARPIRISVHGYCARHFPI